MEVQHQVEEDEEVVDGVPVLAGETALERPQAGAVAVQAAAVAGASLVAGATAVAVLRGLRGRRGAVRLGGRRRGSRLDVVASRTFLVDVHLVDRR